MPEQLSDLQYLQRFNQAIIQKQGVDEQDKRYYTPITEDVRGNDLCAVLMAKVTRTLSPAVILVTGPKGSGKTSELLRFGREVKEQTPGRRFLYVDITDLLRETEQIDAGLLLTAIVAGLFMEVDKDPDLAKVKTIDRPGLLTRFGETMRRLRIDGFDLGAGVPVGPVELDAKVRVSLRDSQSFRQQVIDAMKNSRMEFREGMFTIIRDLARILAGDQGFLPVLVIDSLEHWRGDSSADGPNNYAKVRESMERVFSDHGDELALPGFHVVYCVPSYIRGTPQRIIDMLNIKVSTPDGEPYQLGLDQLKAILKKRAPADGGLERLFGTEEHLEQILRASGGLFRDLFRLTEAVIDNSRTLPASDQSISRALAEERRHFQGGPNGMNREQLQLLKAIDQDLQFNPSSSQQLDFDILETVGAILRYPDGELGYWLGVHPLLAAVLNTVSLPE